MYFFIHKLINKIILFTMIIIKLFFPHIYSILLVFIIIKSIKNINIL